ncbi:disease resistance protein RUN1-like [Eucalyptus grandis]|uniref:disease resistance protein RUN1-like n=1 Tax=Eucalyptus grandis TaxID=71139 RepID=UPI00192E916B|nr:disease resistance protein RUN1-like [Eucalyptus grandis]
MHPPIEKCNVSVHRNAEDADTGASDLLTAPTKTNSGGSSSLTASIGNYYDVFLNFRGVDTRKGFTDHLYNGLVDAGIHTFRDNNEIREGEMIGPDLLTAIKNMEPAHVRHQIGSFGDAFHKRERRFDPTIFDKWKQALLEVTSLKGWEADGYEGELVKSIVRKVLSELKEKFELDISENLVGINSHVEKIIRFVDKSPCDTLFVGIHGMGGIGKTTLAKTIYNKLLNKFEYCSFIANIRESGERFGIHCLQNQLIVDILKQDNQARNKDEGIKILSSMLKGKKVLILLDDVDDYDQLKALAGNHHWFSSGSRIIITTRNKSILDNAEVNYNYEHEELDRDKSLILFSRHAFRKDSPPSEFEDLAYDAVSTTGGLPLSLEVLGSYLCGQKPILWEDTIKKLRKVPHKKVQEKLRISYEALDYRQKQIFLDIACFFIGTSKRKASYMWDACDFFPKEGIEVLKFLSLIKVGDNHELRMHDQLRDLGREIVREENEQGPEYRSRLWDSTEVWEVLKANEGTKKIEAICLSSAKPLTKATTSLRKNNSRS